MKFKPTLCPLVSSADNLYKQFGPRSGQTLRRALSGSKLLVTLIVFLKGFFEKADFEKKSADNKHIQNYPVGTVSMGTYRQKEFFRDGEQTKGSETNLSSGQFG